MDVEIVIDQNQKEPKIIARTDRNTEEVTEIIKKLSDEKPQMIAGYYGDVLRIIDPIRLI
ncbi:MAG: hypothetical protein JW817_07700 [Clostridiales bacterium]|nr:hypothetical protein [Clostridiales bacterium]